MKQSSLHACKCMHCGSQFDYEKMEVLTERGFISKNTFSAYRGLESENHVLKNQLRDAVMLLHRIENEGPALTQEIKDFLAPFSK